MSCASYTDAQIRSLAALREAPLRRRPNDYGRAASRTHRAWSASANTIRSLVARGLVVVEHDEGGEFAALSDKGRALMEGEAP